jgi:hypothetical protein
VADFKRSKTSHSRILTLDLPGEAIAREVAQLLAQKLGRKIIVRDGEDFELWTVGPKMDS